MPCIQQDKDGIVQSVTLDNGQRSKLFDDIKQHLDENPEATKRLQAIYPDAKDNSQLALEAYKFTRSEAFVHTAALGTIPEDFNKNGEVKLNTVLDLNHPILDAISDKTELKAAKSVETQAIIDKATKNGTIGKAPNGKPSLLDTQSWATVRTKAFKEYFGDFEAAAKEFNSFPKDKQTENLKNSILYKHNVSHAVDENLEPKMWYHGTKTRNELLKSFSPEVANERSKGFRKEFYLSPEPDFAFDYTYNKSLNEGFANVKKPFDYENAADKQVLRSKDATLANILEGSDSDDNNWSIVEDKKMQSFLKENGYDGFYVKEQGIKNLAVYDSKQFKEESNYGSFDSTNDRFQYQFNGKQHAIESVIKGFELEPKKVGAQDGYVSKNEKSSVDLQKRIYNWLKENGEPNVQFMYDRTSGLLVPFARDNGEPSNRFQYQDQITPKDVKVRKAPGDAGEFDGVHQVVHNDKVIGEMYYDRSQYNAWVDSNDDFMRHTDFKMVLGDNKEEAIKELVDRYNKKTTQFQQDSTTEAKGAYDRLSNTIYALTNPDVSTPLHELAHSWEPFLNEDEKSALKDWSGKEDWSEDFAKGFEAYLADGKAPTEKLQSIFDKFKEWLTNLFKSSKQLGINELSPKMNEIYDRMLGKDKEQLIEQPNSIEPTTLEQPIEEVINQPEPVAAVQNEEPAPEPSTYIQDKDGKVFKVEETTKAGNLVTTDTQGNSKYIFKEDANTYTNSTEEDFTNSQIISTNKEPTSKYQIGDKISYGKGDNKKDLIVSYVKQNELGQTVYETEVPVYGATGNLLKTRPYGDVLESQINAPAEDAKLDTTKQQLDGAKTARKQILTRIADKFTKVFPQIGYSIADYTDPSFPESKRFFEPARFYHGEVQLNAGYDWAKASAETATKRNESVAHEFMHPFIKALEISNPELYKNLNHELNTDPLFKKYIDQVKQIKGYDQLSTSDKNNEAMVRFLAEELTKNFNPKGGRFNFDYSEERSRIGRLLDKFVNWFKNVVDYITGKPQEVNRPAKQFVDKANEYLSDTPKLLKEQAKDFGSEKFIKEFNGITFDKARAKILNKVKEFGLEDEAQKQLTDADYTVSNPNKEGTISIKSTDGEPLGKILKTQDKDFNTIYTDDKGNLLGKTRKEAINAFVDNFNNEGGVSKKNLYSYYNIPKEQQEDFGNFIDNLNDYNPNLEKFKFNTINDEAAPSVELTQNEKGQVEVNVNENNINSLIGKKEVNGGLLPEDIIEYGNVFFKDNHTLRDQFQDIVSNTYQRSKQASDPANTLTAKMFTKGLSLQDVADTFTHALQQNTLNEQPNRIKSPSYVFTYADQEIDAFKELEDYMRVSNEDQDTLQKIADRIEAKIPYLNDTARTRIKGTESSPIMETDARNLGYGRLEKGDAQYVLDYVNTAFESLKLAARKYNNVIRDLKTINDLPKEARDTELQRLNKEFHGVTQLASVYDDYTKLYDDYHEEFTDHNADFDKLVRQMDKMRRSMSNTAADLVTEWLYPYIEKNNAFLEKEGRADQMLTRDDLKNNLRYGTEKDISYQAYNLGSIVTSRDPVNAAFGNIMADALHLANIDIDKSTFDLNKGYVDFIKGSGISMGNQKAKEQYYNDNYYRKAKWWTVTSYDENNNPVYGYKEKTALHTQYLDDVFVDELRKYQDRLTDNFGTPNGHEQFSERQHLIDKWIEKNQFSDKFRNKDFDKLYNKDKWFTQIHDQYQESNGYYGDKKLQYGIIPQVLNIKFLDKLKDKYKAATGKEFDAEDDSNIEKAKSLGLNALSLLNKKSKDKGSLNVDNSFSRDVKTDLTNINKDDDDVEKDIHQGMLAFIRESNQYKTLKDSQASAENLRSLINGNTKLNIEARKVGKEDFEREQYERKILEKNISLLKAKGDNITPEEKQKLNDYIDELKNIKTQPTWDKILKRIVPADTQRVNKQLIEQIDDVFYGDNEFVEQFKLFGKTVSPNKIAEYLRLYAGINNMTFNLPAAVGSTFVRNYMALIEAHGSKYFSKKDLASAYAEYAANFPNFISDIKDPIKSKLTQLTIRHDAIQGEFPGLLGHKSTGNIAAKFWDKSSLFLIQHAAEHQIQSTLFISLLKAQQVDLKDGTKTNLFDAYQLDKNGRVQLRPDANWTTDQETKFNRTLHSLNREINGNYSEINKSHLSRLWWGKSILQYRKYLYDAFRARWSTERVNYEKNTVEKGYMRYFISDYLLQNLRKNEYNLGKNYNKLSPNEKYYVRKASGEFASYFGLMLIAAGLQGFGNDKKKVKDMSLGEKQLLLYTLRLKADLGMYQAEAGTETIRQLKNPTSTLKTVKNLTDFVGQLKSPHETYQQSGSGHKQGDNKLAYKFRQLLPILNQIKPNATDERLKYLINDNN